MLFQENVQSAEHLEKLELAKVGGEVVRANLNGNRIFTGWCGGRRARQSMRLVVLSRESMNAYIVTPETR